MVLYRVPNYAEEKASQSLWSNKDGPSSLGLLDIIRQERRARSTDCFRSFQGGQTQTGGHLRSPQQHQGRAVELVELEVAIRYIHIEVRPADYAEIVALPIPSICGCGDFSRHSPELGIRPVKRRSGKSHLVSPLRAGARITSHGLTGRCGSNCEVILAWCLSVNWQSHPRARIRIASMPRLSRAAGKPGMRAALA